MSDAVPSTVARLPLPGEARLWTPAQVANEARACSARCRAAPHAGQPLASSAPRRRRWDGRLRPHRGRGLALGSATPPARGAPPRRPAGSSPRPRRGTGTPGDRGEPAGGGPSPPGARGNAEEGARPDGCGGNGAGAGSWSLSCSAVKTNRRPQMSKKLVGRLDRLRVVRRLRVVEGPRAALKGDGKARAPSLGKGRCAGFLRPWRRRRPTTWT